MAARTFRIVLMALAGALALGCSGVSAPPPAAVPPDYEVLAVTKVQAPADPKKNAAALALAIDGYIYGYPLVTMEVMRRVVTNVAAPTGRGRAPQGQLAPERTLPSVHERAVAPELDTLNSTAWIDVSDEPWVIELPATPGRYAVFSFLDGWTEVFASLGTRTTGGRAQKIALTGPGFAGQLPTGVVEHKSPTGLVWMLGRIQSGDSPAEFAKVGVLQDRMRLYPLSAAGQAVAPAAAPVDPRIQDNTAVREQTRALTVVQFFHLLAQQMVENPPAPADADLIARLGALGFVPGQPFDGKALDPAVLQALQEVPKRAQVEIFAHLAERTKSQDGWSYQIAGVGKYGSRYLDRAATTMDGIAAFLPEDVVLPVSHNDVNGTNYSGAARYVLHFDKGQLPPADGLWSLTLYDEGFRLVDNEDHRHRVSSKTGIKPNRDGSLDIYIQRDSPGKGRETNWLPPPITKFVLVLRLYQPRKNAPSILDGSWRPPGVIRVE